MTMRARAHRRRWRLRLLLAAVTIAVGLTGVSPNRQPTAALAAGGSPAATLTVPLSSGDQCGSCLSSDTRVFEQANSVTAPVTVDATPSAGASVASIALQYARQGTPDAAPMCTPGQTTGCWTRTISPPFPASPPYTTHISYGLSGNSFQSTSLYGDYLLRAQVIDSSGQTAYSPDVPIVLDPDSLPPPGHQNAANYIGLQQPTQALHGTVSLLAAQEQEGSAATSVQPDTVQFEIAPAGSGNYRKIGDPVSQEVDGAGNLVWSPFGGPQYTTSFDTTTLPDGTYDLTTVSDDSATAQSNGTSPDLFVPNTVTVTVVNAPPTITLDDPGSPLSGSTTLTAHASASAGVASVRFQYAPAGGSTWTTIGVSTSAPYTVGFDTRGLANGTYDLRAVATDTAGKTATDVRSGIQVANAAGAAGGGSPSFSVTNQVVPANGGSTGSPITLLGEVSNSGDHETWAYGYSTAPPATVDGAALRYAAAPGSPQFVLLRFTDATGWQIADVLRDQNGTAWNPPAGAKVTGQMLSTGEAWIAVAANGTVSMFHRSPGGQFTLDAGASGTLGQMFTNTSWTGMSPQLVLGQGPDGVYGTVVNPAQPPGSNHQALLYGSLKGATWSLNKQAQPPPNAQTTGTLTLLDASPTGPGTGWAVVGALTPAGTPAAGTPLELAQYNDTGGWQYAPSTGLDALDLTGSFAGGSGSVRPNAILAADDGVWIGARVNNKPVVALYDPGSGRVTHSWCDPALLAQSNGCESPLDANHPAEVPQAVFDTAQGPVGVALGGGTAPAGFVDVYTNGQWSAVAATGFDGSDPGTALFTSPTDGWLAGSYAVGRITAQPQPSPLTEWPEANQSTLLAAAAPTSGAGTGTFGALAIGLHGTALHYDPAAGWLVDPVPARARSANLRGVAFGGPSQAVAVGSFGTILNWDGTSWSADAASTTVTQSQLNAVAFAPDGQGWAVGVLGTILHYANGSWTSEQIDSGDAGADVTSVAVAGNDVYAVAGGNLISSSVQGAGAWSPVRLPASVAPGSLTLVSGLPDGGLVVAGKSIVLERDGPSSAFNPSPQPIEGTAVALTSFRAPGSGQLRAFVSVAPPPVALQGGNPITLSPSAAFPSGDGELLVQTDSGWKDLSQSQYAGQWDTVPGDGVPEPDPVLAVAASGDGGSAWAVGGYAGTPTASGTGSTQPLQARSSSWQTSTIWRYDSGGSASSPALTQGQVDVPAQPHTVNFAYLSDAACYTQCAAVQGAQPTINLRAAASEIAAFGAQPGGPAFAMLGGNAVGPSNLQSWQQGAGAVDFANLPSELAGLGSVPLYAAYGPQDPVPTQGDQTAQANPWADALSGSPAPFGSGPAPGGITPVSSGDREGPVNHYYSYDVSQNGGTLRVVVLDNSQGSLERSAPGQTQWLDGQLSGAQDAHAPVVVICAEPLDSALPGAATDADQVAAKLAAAGVLGVFTTSQAHSDQQHMVPFSPSPNPNLAQIPEYEGASLTYQQPQNSGVLWYDVSVDTAARTLSVQGIPVVSSLALEPLSGLSAPRSSTLSFDAVGRRPSSTLIADDDPAQPKGPPQGYPNYVAIPATCSSPCVKPSYKFTSSVPGVGTFVAASAPGSPFPALNAQGKPTPSSSSGLFCAFNAGTTIVSVTSGLLTSSQAVTVQPGPIGQPCGTVAYAPDENVVTIRSNPLRLSQEQPSGTQPPPPPPPAGANPAPTFPKIALPAAPVIHPAPAPAAAPPPPPVKPPPPPHHKPVVRHPAPVVAFPAAPQVINPNSSLASAPVVPPLIPPALTPVPPGGATVSAQATARREEKARKHASQSAFMTRPAGASPPEWFYAAAGVATLLTLLLLAGGARPGPRRRPAVALAWSDSRPHHPRHRSPYRR